MPPMKHPPNEPKLKNLGQLRSRHFCKMLKDTGYLTVLNYISYTLVFFLCIHHSICQCACFTVGLQLHMTNNFQTCTNLPTDHRPLEFQPFSALQSLERWRITSMSLHIACRQLNPQLATSAFGSRTCEEISMAAAVLVYVNVPSKCLGLVAS